MLGSILLWGLAAQVRHDPPVRQDIRVFIHEEFDEESEHERYEQLFPVGAAFGSGNVRGRVTLTSSCAWRTKQPTLSPAPLRPQEEDPWRWDPRVPPPDPLPWEFPPRTPNSVPDAPLTLTLQVSPLTTRLRTGSGSGFDLSPLRTQGGQIAPPAPNGGAVVTPGPPPQPPPPPPQTKGQDPAAKGILGSGGAGGSEEADTPLLVGPELAVPLRADVTEWDLLAWLPEATGLSAYGHALFGEMTIHDARIDVALYGLGTRLAVPLLRTSGLSADGLLSAGPAFLHSEIGDAAGLEAAAGLGARLRLAGTLAFTVSAEFRGYAAPDVAAYGPSFNVGLDLGW